eukprot:1160041-Pelagomonas_calceolata.AAC.3
MRTISGLSENWHAALCKESSLQHSLFLLLFLLESLALPSGNPVSFAPRVPPAFLLDFALFAVQLNPAGFNQLRIGGVAEERHLSRYGSSSLFSFLRPPLQPTAHS